MGEHLSFRSAASSLGVRQSAISQRMRRLEDQLGVSLFERHPRGVRLTLAGERFLGQVRILFGQLNHAVHYARAAGRGEEGDLKIGISTSLAEGFLPALVRRYAAEHPDVRIAWQEGPRQTLLEEIRARRLDVVFIPGNGHIVGCDTQEVWGERLHVALPRSHPLTVHNTLGWDDLRGERLVVSHIAPGPEVHDYVVRRLANDGRRPQVEREPVSQATLLHLVGLGSGLSLVLTGRLRVDIPAVILRPLRDDADVIPFSAVWSPENGNPAWRRFLSTARTMLAEIERAQGSLAAAKSNGERGKNVSAETDAEP